VGRLFAGTALDRPTRCERCNALESDCLCPPTAVQGPRAADPGKQTARIRVEKRPRGKVATLISQLDPTGDHLEVLAAQLKSLCGSGGTVKAGSIELQGDHRERVAAELTRLGYKVRA
jgi:translation initiation factor 1